MRRLSLGKVLAFLVGANLLLGAGLFALRPPWRVPEEIVPRPPLPAQAQALQARINEGRHGAPYTLDLSDAELTDMVGYFLGGSSDVPFTRVRVAVTGQQVIMDGLTKGLAVTLPVRVVGTVGARDGRPWARVENVSLGDTQVPAFVRNQIVSQANASLDFSRYDMAVTVDAIELRPGGATIRGIVK